MERFAILVAKDEKKAMKKRLKKHDLKFLEALPVDRTTLLVVYGIRITDDKVDDLKNIELYMVEGTMENYKNYCEDPYTDVAQYSITTYYNNEEES